ncbi:hypothetical protein EV207_103113 [Scopulibacillus darangshiensis]|uniref:DUF600 family protein n=1 Tax=Scopulibacillus darangshiensis TaxID=442528 RepID=A0A4R2P8D3_9BACL|nr:DUF600 domain-containing protein [Scopulibacillus darangshiensis]TCP31230.1 hypothetical protein EV207_103113 [Scopulibacillus darangshiensis]
MEKVFEDHLSELQTDMVAISLEYVDDQAEEIYIYCSYEPEAYYFNVFYKIAGEFVLKHQINDRLNQKTKHVYDTSIDRQKALLKIGREDLELIHKRCKKFNRDMPTEMKLKYNVKENSLNAKYNYDLVYSNDEDLLPTDIFESWVDEISNGKAK